MRSFNLAPALLLLAAAAAADTATQTTTTTTSPAGTVTIRRGVVVRQDPGQLIALRDASGNIVEYRIASGVTIPGDVVVGREISLEVEPQANLVRRVVTSVTPGGTTTRTETSTVASPRTGTTTTTETTTITGTVSGFEASRRLVLRQPDGTEVTYLLDKRSVLPREVAVGKTVTVEVFPRENVVRTVSFASASGVGGTTTTISEAPVVDPNLIAGTVVLYQPGKVLELRRADGEVVSYTLAPDVVVPATLAPGVPVKVSVQATASGQGRVTRVTTTEVQADGRVRTTTKETATDAMGNTSTTTETTVTGTVAEVGSRTLTVRRSDGTQIAYEFDPAVVVIPEDLAVGRQVRLVVGSLPGGRAIVRSVRYYETSTTSERNP